MEKIRILVIEDNADTRQFLETALSKDYEVICAENAVIGIDYARNKHPDLILLDIMMPMLSGFDACELLKKDEATKNIPVIFLSAKNTVKDITDGLGLGAEDYLPKPFDYKELIARINARLRQKTTWQSEPKTLTTGELRLVMDTRDTYYANKLIPLTSTEFDILRILVQKAGHVIPRAEIIKKVWKSNESETHRRTIDVHIRALRKKIPALKKHVLSIYGVGYKFEL